MFCSVFKHTKILKFKKLNYKCRSYAVAISKVDEKTFVIQDQQKVPKASLIWLHGLGDSTSSFHELFEKTFFGAPTKVLSPQLYLMIKVRQLPYRTAKCPN